MNKIKTSIPPSHEHPFAQYVRILGKGKKGSRSLTEEEAFTAMSMIMDGQVLDVQLGAFLMLLRVKEETSDELLGFVKAVRNSINAPDHLNVSFDWSSYAGKRRHLPWYILSILLLAQSGERIFIHGASGHTIDRLYTEQVLESLGFATAKSWADCEDHLDKTGFCYYPLHFLSPKLHEIIELRNTMGLRSPVHTLARLLNPCNADHVMQGIFHPGYRPVHQEAARDLGYQHVAVIKGEAGEIERNPDADCLVQRVENGALFDDTWPPLFNRRHMKEELLDIETLKAVWKGGIQHEYGEAAIWSTTAIALALKDKTLSQDSAITRAKQLWETRDQSLLS